MSKKLTGLLAVLACLLMLTACGAAPAAEEQQVPEDTRSSLFALAETTASQLDEVVNAGLIEEQKSLPAVYAGLQSWETAKAEIGSVDFTTDADGNGIADCFTEKSVTMDEDGNYIVTVGVTGETKSADLVTTINGDITQFVSIVTNVNYSFNELIGQAAMNTLLGMGTTFAVLILLSLIIALFGSIFLSRQKAKEAEAEKKEKEEAQKSSPVETVLSAEPAAAAPADGQPDDGTLIAVLSAAVHAAENDDATVAVIAAAIAEYESGTRGMQMPADPEEFVARRIRRIRRK